MPPLLERPKSVRLNSAGARLVSYSPDHYLATVESELLVYLSELKFKDDEMRAKAIREVNGRKYILKATLIQSWMYPWNFELRAQNYVAYTLSRYKSTRIADFKVQPVDLMVYVRRQEIRDIAPHLKTPHYDDWVCLGISFCQYIEGFTFLQLQPDLQSDMELEISRLTEYIYNQGIRAADFEEKQCMFQIDQEGKITLWVVDYEDWAFNES